MHHAALMHNCQGWRLESLFMLKLVWSIVYRNMLLVALVVMEIMLGSCVHVPTFSLLSGLSYTSCCKATNALSKSMLNLSFYFLSLSLCHTWSMLHSILLFFIVEEGEEYGLKSHLYAYEKNKIK